MDNSDELISIRNSIVRELLDLSDYVDATAEDMHPASNPTATLKARFRRLPEIQSRFVEAQNGVMAMASVDSREARMIQNEVRVKFEKVYGDTVNKYQELLRHFVISTPIFSMPKFSGHPEEWMDFRNARKMLEENVKENILRLRCMKDAVSGKAAELICALQESDANYSFAWYILEHHYEQSMENTVMPPPNVPTGQFRPPFLNQSASCIPKNYMNQATNFFNPYHGNFGSSFGPMQSNIRPRNQPQMFNRFFNHQGPQLNMLPPRRPFPFSHSFDCNRMPNSMNGNYGNTNFPPGNYYRPPNAAHNALINVSNNQQHLPMHGSNIRSYSSAGAIRYAVPAQHSNQPPVAKQITYSAAPQKYNIPSSEVKNTMENQNKTTSQSPLKVTAEKQQSIIQQKHEYHYEISEPLQACIKKVKNLQKVESLSVNNLRSFLKEAKSSVNTLKHYLNNVSKDYLLEQLIICSVSCKLGQFKTNWEVRKDKKEMHPTFEEFCACIIQKCEEENEKSMRNGLSNKQDEHSLKNNSKTIPTGENLSEASVVFGKKRATDDIKEQRSKKPKVDSIPPCFICSGTHHVFECLKFLAMTPSQRIKTVGMQRICNNCLRSNCETTNCHFKTPCEKCGKYHHSLLHIEVTSSASLAKEKALNEKCGICLKIHQMKDCPVFLKMSWSDRIQAVRFLKVCVLCLRADCNVHKCPNKINCLKCSSPHNTLLHPKLDSDRQDV